jgi:hypothetical protein
VLPVQEIGNVKKGNKGGCIVDAAAGATNSQTLKFSHQMTSENNKI